MAAPSFDHQKLSNRILAALGLGLLFGVALNLTVADQDWARVFLIDGALRVVGEIFVRLLSMLVVPLVFVSLITGVSALSDPASLGRIGGKAVLLYMLTTGVAIALAMVGALIVQPGVGASPAEQVARQIAEQPSFGQVLINMVPRNPVAAMASGDMLPIILFAILVGLAIAMSGDSGKRVGGFFTDLNAVIMRLVEFVMLVAPYGVFALIAVLGRPRASPPSSAC